MKSFDLLTKLFPLQSGPIGPPINASKVTSKISLLLQALLSNGNHCVAGLPYNLNWGFSGRKFDEFLSRHPIIVADIGARGSSIKELEFLKKYIKYYGFDADKAECERINLHPPEGFHSYYCYPYFIGRDESTVQFNLYKQRGFSSQFLLDDRYRRLFAEPENVVEQVVELQSASLDSALAKEALAPPDVLKVDSQGTELEILRSSPLAVESATLVEVEVEIMRMYAGQFMFHEVHEFMVNSGFELLYMNRVFAQRKPIYSGPSRGQIVFADVLYGKSDTTWDRYSPEQLAKYAITLLNYGHHDIAFQIYQEHDEVRKLCPQLNDYFQLKQRGILQRGIISQFDKLACLFLHMRKFNQLRTDSDRSWPIR